MKKLVILVTGLATIILLAIISTTFVDKTPIQLVSPLIKNEKVLGANLWFPHSFWDVQSDGPVITAEGALFIDSKSGQTLFNKNANKRLPVASLVKVMTALIALEHKDMDDTYLVSQRASEMEPDEMILLPGETLSLKELLYGIFLISANDAAEVLAEGTVGSRDEFTSRSEGSEDRRSRFIRLMNAKTLQLDMKDTYFANPTGLDEDSNSSYSTAYDMAILTRYLIRNYPEVVEISKIPYIFIPQTNDHQSYEMWSGINLLTTYPGVVGFKTGYTPEAGLTLITLARKNGHEIIGVLLGSDNRRDEARELLDYSFKKLTNFH